MTKEKLIGNLLANQARVAESHGERKGDFCFLWTKKFGKIGRFGLFFSVTPNKVSKLN
jgi:hypothetical protein